MNRRSLLATTAACVVMGAVRASAAASTSGSAMSDAEQVGALQQALVDAYIRRDVPAMRRILADDYQFTDDRGAVKTKSDVLRDSAPGGDRTITSYVIRDAKVRVYGDAAVMTYAYRSTEQYQGREEDGDYRITRIFIRKNGNWRIVSGHETRIATTGRDT